MYVLVEIKGKQYKAEKDALLKGQEDNRVQVYAEKRPP
jgi:ribosomal protein L21